MTITFADDTRNGMMDLIAKQIDAGGAPGKIELISTTGTLLSVLKFSYPSAAEVSGGVLQFNPIAEDPSARVHGIATLAQITDSRGVVVFECDVSDTSGNGAIKLNSNVIIPGGPVRLTSFTLSAP